MSDQIIIKGLRLSCHIGVPEAERECAQILRAHLTLDVPPFPTDDTIAGTVDYQAVSDQVRELASGKERQLIETLAQDIATHVLQSFEVTKIRVEIEKRILSDTDWVGVIIERENSEN